MTPKNAYADLKKRMNEISTLTSTESVLHWDQESYMPTEANDHRAEQITQISRLLHEWFTDPAVGDLISTIEDSDLMKSRESEVAVNVREWRRLYDQETKLPTDFVEDFTRTTSKALQAWAEARRSWCSSRTRRTGEWTAALLRVGPSSTTRW